MKSSNKRYPEQNKKVSSQRKAAYFLASLLFVVTITVLFGLSFDFFDRSTFSEDEKRELAAFPEFSFAALFNGDYFDGISLWFSDTFPFRDTLIKISSTLKKFMGMGQSVHNFSENSGDAIPDAEVESQALADVTAGIANQSQSDDLLKPALPPSAMEGGNTQNTGNVIEQNLDYVYIYGNTAYEYFNFSQSVADKYISVVNAAANKAKQNGMNLYNMIVPTSIDITLNENSRKNLNCSDQKDAINYIYSGMNENVKTVQIFDLLKAHKDEYLYFRTDHHWTALGAYYAYAQLMTVKGEKYEPLSNFTQYSFPGFLGSFYNDTNKNDALGSSPDTVYAFMPQGEINYKIREKGKTEFMEWPLICDATQYSTSNKYLCFIGGDSPIGIIENNSVQNNDSCIFIKESFGNAFAPYLANHYKYVYIIDYRHFDVNIMDYAVSNGVKDIIIQNNISMVRNASLVDRLGQML